MSKLTFKAFLDEASSEQVQFRIEDSDLEEYSNAIQFDIKIDKLPQSLISKIKALDASYFSEDGFVTVSLENKNREKMKKLFTDLGYIEVKKF